MACNHKRKGRVTNQPDGYDDSIPHASESVCDRRACIESAIRRVAGRTNMTAVLVLDADRGPMPEPML